MKKSLVFRGVATALATPFTECGIDYIALAKMIDFQLSNGIDALVICGTTGESATLSDEEKKELIAFAVRQVRNRVPVIAGTGCNDTKRATALSEYAARVGADAILAVTPYYNKCTQNGLVEYYKAICEAVSIPVIAYNVPGRTGVEIQPATMAKIAEIPNIAGIKDAGGNMSKTMETFRLVREKCDVYSGEDALNLPILACGGAGVISVLSNVVPADVKKLCTLVKDGKLQEAIELNDKLLPLANACFVEVNPIPVKQAMNLLGFDAGTPRAPLTKLEPQNEEKLRAAMKNYGLEINV